MADMDGPVMMNRSAKAAFGPLGSGAFEVARHAGYDLSMNGGSQFYNRMEMTSMDQGMSGNLETMRDEYNMYDGMALNDDFLKHYYFNVSENILQMHNIFPGLAYRRVEMF